MTGHGPDIDILEAVVFLILNDVLLLVYEAFVCIFTDVYLQTYIYGWMDE
jgi:hypothetical protein